MEPKLFDHQQAFVEDVIRLIDEKGHEFMYQKQSGKTFALKALENRLAELSLTRDRKEVIENDFL